MEEERYRSQLVERLCPYTGKRVLGFITLRLRREPGGEGWEEEVFRAQCLHRESCGDLGCERGIHPFKP
jgi:hypothetical protein